MRATSPCANWAAVQRPLIEDLDLVMSGAIIKF
jgi:hypothetical protein